MSDPATPTLESCVVCGGEQFDIPVHGDALFSCRSCGLVFRPGRDGAGLDHAFYEEQHFVSIEPDWIDGRRRVFAHEIRRLASFRQTGRLLDVGAGHGFFLSACQDDGWQATGIEISRQAAAYARDNFALEIIETPIETAPLPEDAFDVVTFWNVLDQVPDPRAAVLAAVRALRPGGLLIVRSPNASFHLRIRQLARSLAGVMPPARKLNRLTVFHLYSFAPAVLQRLLTDAGMQSAEITAAPLSWTKRAGDQTGFARKLLSQSIYGGAVALQVMSGGRLQYCPSIVARAIKPSRTLPAALPEG